MGSACCLTDSSKLVQKLAELPAERPRVRLSRSNLNSDWDR